MAALVANAVGAVTVRNGIGGWAVADKAKDTQELGVYPGYGVQYLPSLALACLRLNK